MDDAPILICYDGSDDAARGIETAAKLFGARRAVVLDVAPYVSEEESLATIAPVVPGNAFVEANEAQADQLAGRGAELARAAGFDAEARVALGTPTWQGVVDVADELDVPVIVIGSGGLTGPKEVFEGSLSHQLAEHAGRPVLITPPPHGA